MHTVASEPAPSRQSESLGLPATVLIAEDEHLVAAELAEQLRSLGIEVVGPTSTGAATIDLARRQKPDMALVDVRMPDGDGLDAADVLQRELGVPVLIVSAYTDPDYVRRGVASGVFGYLLKPVTAEQLAVELPVVWACYQQRQRLSDEVEELKTALADRKLIERAKGLLMEKLSLPEPDAMRQLQRHARNTRRRLAEVAKAVIEDGELLADGSSDTA